MAIESDPRVEIVWLGEDTSHDPKRVGLKAAHLSRLAASFRVPPGFCLAADVYRAAGSRARVTETVRAAVADAYRQLAELIGDPEPSVAVRSSATDEDAQDASFAGQYATLLNITGIDALVVAIETIWRSAHSEPSWADRRTLGLSADDVSLAVLVQALVPADVSGVLFSANPVTGRRDEYVVSASWGLGESIVRGSVTPDDWVLDAESLEVRRETISDKRCMTIAVDGGIREIEVPEALRHRPSMSPEQLRAVARLGTRLEEVTGWPVDAEFAFTGGRLYLLQCRPITASDPASSGTRNETE
jgi:phosphoenolpyruvate synthase/pyruvate phosphate dikinase